MITEAQLDKLVTKIYDLLMDMPEMGLGEMNDAKEAAQEIVYDWVAENAIQVF